MYAKFRKAECHFPESRFVKICLLCVIILSVVMLSVNTLNVVFLNVVAPLKSLGTDGLFEAKNAV